MSVEREIHSLIDEMLGDDSRRSLAAYRRFSTEHLPWLERRAVLAGRRRGDSWAAIGRLLGRSRQSVQQRFDRSFSIDELRAPTQPLSAPDAAHHFYAMVRQDLARERRADAAGDDNGLVPW
jgi:IS30 family transposase